MFICYKCGHELQKNNDNFTCLNCDAAYPIIDDVPYFYSEVNTSINYNYEEYSIEIEKIRKAENKHFWFQSRRELILKNFNKFVKKEGESIEIGSGTGSIARMLKDNGFNMSIGEIHFDGINYAKMNNDQEMNIYQFDITRNPFKNHFDTVGIFDVLEHIENDNFAIDNIKSMLKPNGILMLTVPAHMMLWCEDDNISNHFRRYNLNALKEMLTEKGFDILFATNFFISILPLLYLRTKFKASSSITINPILNIILLSICRIENYLLQFITSRIGGSIIIVARKKNDPF